MQKINIKTPWFSFFMVPLWQKEDTKVWVFISCCDSVISVNSAPSHSCLCDSAQVKLCVTPSSSASTPCRSTASTTWMNAWKVPWLRRRSSLCTQITASHLAVRWTNEPNDKQENYKHCYFVCAMSHFTETSISTFICRDGSKICHQSWRLNCQDLNSTLSSAALRRYTRNWNSHRSFIWTGERWTDNTIMNVWFHSVSNVPTWEMKKTSLKDNRAVWILNVL